MDKIIFLRFLERWNKKYFEVSSDEQENFFIKLGPGKNYWDRSYKQYLCQNYYYPSIEIFVLNILSAIVYVPLLLYLWIIGLSKNFEKNIEGICHDKSMDEIIPEILRNKYRLDTNVFDSGYLLTFKDVKYVASLAIRYFYVPYFVFKTTIKIAMYSSLFKRFKPQVMIVHNEMSFTSSILTDFCHKHHVKHINIMHGEKLRFMRDSYFQFDEFFVWDEYYKNMFIKQMAEPSQFRIAIPPSMFIDKDSFKDESCYADYKYYLAYNTEGELKQILKSMVFAKKEHKTVKYRLHPRYSDVSTALRILGRENIEFPKETSIEFSIANCGCAVGSYTTVLNQAYHSGVNVMFDDVTYKDLFEKLKAFDYILIDKKLPRLSEKQQND